MDITEIATIFRVREAAATEKLYKKSIVDLFRNLLSDLQLQKLDACVMQYLLDMLEGQCDEESYMDADVIVKTLCTYFVEFKLYPSEEAAEVVARKLVDTMAANGISKKPPEQAKRLEHAVNIGRQYEENLKKASKIGLSKVVVNTNDEWTWDSKRSAAKDDRRRKKEEEKKAMLREEYEDFLKKKGVASSQDVFKLHKSDGIAYSTDIKCEDIHIHMGKQVLLDHANLILHTGHKYGLVGRNGAGKTTLLRALSEKELEGVSPFLQILHVEQEINSGTESPLEVILAADVERTQLVKEEQELLNRDDDAASQRLKEVYDRMDAIDAHSAESRVQAILHGLSFTPEMMTNPTKSLSGGWRMRVALARALFVEPEVLLLDEPTNHLDLHAVMWLENFLKSWKGTYIVVSHSRSFLNNVCEEIVHLNQFKLEYYKGNYDQFEITRYEQLRLQTRQHESQEKKRAHMQAFIDRFRYKASKAKMAQSRIKSLERMESVSAVISDPQFSFRFPDPEPMPGSFLQLVDAEFGYKPGQTIFKDVNFGLDENSRIVLVGANGAGKSTFMSVCRGMLEPRHGQAIRNQKIRIGHFAQHHLEYLTPQLSSVEFLRSKFPHMEDQYLRAHLGSMGLSGEKALQPIYTLSGGQKSRLALAWVSFTKPHLLLLDEPTNHLDIDTVTALIDALLAYQGGLLVISHDEHFITSLCDEIYVCGNEKIERFDGDFEEYRASITKSLR